VSSPHQPTDSLADELDLDSARSARAEVTRTPAVKIAGRRLELPTELPLDALEPLTAIDVDVSVLIRQVLDARNQAKETGETADNEAILGAIIDMLVVNPSLPVQLIDAVKEITRRLFGPEGYEHLVASKLSIKDVGLIAKYIGRQYGVGLGEASPASESSEAAGTTSKSTSSASTTSTSAASGSRRARKAS
jgi:hypothetical protein